LLHKLVIYPTVIAQLKKLVQNQELYNYNLKDEGQRRTSLLPLK